MASRFDFERIVEKVISFEGGLSTDRNDPGNWTGGNVGEGEFKGTKWGISAASYPDLDIESLTPERAKEIYYLDYWMKSACDHLGFSLAFIHFDTAVNMSVGTALAILKASEGEPWEYFGLRLERYTKLGNWERYDTGWTRRMARLARDLVDLYTPVNPQGTQGWRVVSMIDRDVQQVFEISQRDTVIRIKPDTHTIYVDSRGE